jgi:hypothetical protein
MPIGEKVVDLVERPENLRLCHRKPGRLLEEFSNGIFPEIAGDISTLPEFIGLLYFVVGIPKGHNEIILSSRSSGTLIVRGFPPIVMSAIWFASPRIMRGSRIRVPFHVFPRTCH